MAEDPVHRRWHHHKMTFGLLYAWTENFVLPLSHDEVVYGKGSILGRMPGDEWQRFANLRAYYGFMWGQPGKKLLFMGQEFGQSEEWNFRRGLEWWLLDYDLHRGVKALLRDLNHLYREQKALHVGDCKIWRVPLDRPRRCRQLRLCLATLRTRWARGGHGVQFYPGPARGLPHRSAVPGPLATGAEY